MLVLSSPSGCGKTTVSDILLRDERKDIVRSVSITTREPRLGEEHGKDYFFVSEQEFFALRESGKLLEHAKVFDSYYGIPKEFVESNIEAGKNTLFVIDWQGAFRLKELMKQSVVSVFIIPPSMAELRRRLYCRESRESDSIIERRLKEAPFEIGHCYNYDYVIVNNDAEETAGSIRCILRAEVTKTFRQRGLREFVEGNFSEL